MSQTPVSFSIGDLISRSWSLFTASMVPLLGAFVIAALVVGAAGGLTYVGGYILSGPFALGLFKMALDTSRGKKIEFGDLFYGFQHFLPAFLMGLVINIFTTIGMILCILPGLFVAIIYLPAFCFLYDDRRDFWPAMEDSRQFVMANLGQWAVLFIVVFALNIVGALACGVGIFITGPLSILMVAQAYDIQRGVPQSGGGDFEDIAEDQGF